MDQIRAARMTFDICAARLNEWTLNWSRIRALPEEMQCPHLLSMVERMEESELNVDVPAMSPAKLGRWLGWLQASFVANGVLTLDEAKEINQRWADER